MYEASLVWRLKDGIGGTSERGDRDGFCRPGEGVEAADALSEHVPPSEAVRLRPDDLVARAAAVAAAASSTVPEW